MPTHVLLTDDLFVAAQVRDQLSALGTVRQVDTLQGLPELIKALSAEVLLIDLSATRVFSSLDFVGALKAEVPNLRLVAFGPHVQVARLEAARRADCDCVLTRGQMLREGARLITELGD